MDQRHPTFGHFVLFKEMLSDELGHLYRTAEISKSGIKRAAFLRVFNGPSVPKEDLLSRFDTATGVAGILHASNVASNSVYLQENGIPAVAWDHVPGQPLGALFRKVRDEGFPVPVDNALLIMEKLALALSAGLAVELDGRPLVHGFLHPGMAVVSNDGEAIVYGFGMADQLLNLLDDPEVAAACAPYVAPEILMTRTASKRGDVYSLGSILYYLLTSQEVPAEAEARAGILDTAELEYDGEPIPKDIKALLSRALAHRPEDRFSSAADFKKELDKLLYGGAYSPTTFNLALFMDRLFRSEIEAEEKDKVTEEQIDYEQYLMPEPEPEPEPIVAAEAPSGKGLWIGLSVVLAAVVIAVAILLPRLMGPAQPLVPPTPTMEEVAAKEQADRERLQALVDMEVQRLMAEKEEEIRTELDQRQQEIERLRRQVKEADRQAQAGTAPSVAEQRRAEELRRQLEQAEAAQKKREEELAEQRRQAAEAARRLAEENAARRRAEEEALLAAQQATQVPPVVKTEPTPTAVVAAAKATAAPSAMATPVARATPVPAPVQPPPDQAAVTIVENMFVDPAEVDTRATLLRQGQPEYGRSAQRSRRRGVAILQATVNASGRVEEVKILRIDETEFGIPEAVQKAAKECVFKPATKNGVRVKSYASITYQYNFQR